MQKLKTDENQRLKQCLPASVTIAACAVNVNPLKDSQPIKGSLCSFPFYYLEAQTAGDFFCSLGDGELLRQGLRRMFSKRLDFEVNALTSLLVLGHAKRQECLLMSGRHQNLFTNR